MLCAHFVTLSKQHMACREIGIWDTDRYGIVWFRSISNNNTWPDISFQSLWYLSLGDFCEKNTNDVSGNPYNPILAKHLFQQIIRFVTPIWYDYCRFNVHFSTSCISTSIWYIRNNDLSSREEVIKVWEARRSNLPANLPTLVRVMLLAIGTIVPLGQNQWSNPEQ